MATQAAVARVESTVSFGGSLVDALSLVSGQSGVPIPALKSAYHSRGKGPGGAHGNARLTVDHEQVLVGAARAISLNNLSLPITQTRAVVKRRWDLDMSQPCVARWLRRTRHHISQRASNALAGVGRSYHRGTLRGWCTANGGGGGGGGVGSGGVLPERGSGSRLAG